MLKTTTEVQELLGASRDELDWLFRSGRLDRKKVQVLGGTRMWTASNITDAREALASVKEREAVGK